MEEESPTLRKSWMEKEINEIDETIKKIKNNNIINILLCEYKQILKQNIAYSENAMSLGKIIIPLALGLLLISANYLESISLLGHLCIAFISESFLIFTFVTYKRIAYLREIGKKRAREIECCLGMKYHRKKKAIKANTKLPINRLKFSIIGTLFIVFTCIVWIALIAIRLTT